MMTPSQFDERLTVNDVELLRALWSQFAGQFFERQKFAAITAERRSGAEQLISLHRLHKYGWLTAKDNGWGEVSYCITESKYPVIQETFFRPTAECFVDQVPLIVKEARAGLLLGDLLIAAAFITQEGLPLTSKGLIHKKSAARLSSRLMLSEEEIADVSIQASPLDIYPLPVNIVVGLLLELQLVTTKQHDITLVDAAWLEWLMLSLQEQESYVYQAILKRCSVIGIEKEMEKPHLQHARQLISHNAFEPGVWFCVNRLLEEAGRQELLPPTAQETLQHELSSWLHTLTSLGFGTLGMTQAGELCYSWASLAPYTGESEKSEGEQAVLFYVQADYEVLVPPHVSMLTQWRLLLICEVVTIDQLTVMRIEQASVLRALKIGITIAEIVDFLTEYSCTGVPHHIQVTLEQWHAAWRSNESLSSLSHVELKCSPAWFVEEVAKEKNNWGYRAAQSSINECAQDTPQSQPVMTSPLMPDGPGQDILFPGVQTIPSMWLEQYRSYHSSTAWLIMEQALLWHTKVLIRIEGSDLEYIPRMLHTANREVEGTLLLSEEESQRVRLSPRDWKEMKLLISPLS